MARVMEGFATPSSSGPPEPSSMTHLPWVAPHSMILSFNEFCKPIRHNEAVVHEGDNYSIILKIRKFDRDVTLFSNLQSIFQSCQLSQ